MLAGLLLLVFVSSTLATCPSGSHFDSTYKKCYRYFGTPSDFLSAEINCLRNGGTLVSIENSYENSYIAAIASCSTTGSFWIGINSVMAANFTWTSGYNGTYRNFAEEPSDLCTLCGAYRERDGKWTKEMCSTKKSYLCQINPTNSSVNDSNSTSRTTPTTTTNPTTAAPTTPRPTTTVPTTTPLRKACPPGWSQNGTFCYFFSDNELPWADAERFCVGALKGAHLTSITSAAENNYIYSLYQAKYPLVNANPNLYTYWVGGISTLNGGNPLPRVPPGPFNWTDGSAFSYTNWSNRPQQPDNGNAGEPCVHVYEANNLGFTPGAWNDITCVQRNHYACKGPAN